MMHRAWSSILEVPYCFSRSYVKFQGHTALKIVEFDPNWAFPDCNSSLNSPMAMKCCTKLETAKERCPIVFQGHPSNFKVTRYKTSPILTQIERFRTIGRSQLSNPSDLPCCMWVTISLNCDVINLSKTGPRDPITWWGFPPQFKFDRNFNMFLSKMAKIATKFCARQDSYAHVACAKVVAIWWPRTELKQN